MWTGESTESCFKRDIRPGRTRGSSRSVYRRQWPLSGRLSLCRHCVTTCVSDRRRAVYVPVRGLCRIQSLDAPVDSHTPPESTDVRDGGTVSHYDVPPGRPDPVMSRTGWSPGSQWGVSQQCNDPSDFSPFRGPTRVGTTLNLVRDHDCDFIQL